MTILDESNPTNTSLVGEGDDHIRNIKSLVADLFKVGHILADSSSGSDDDGQLKFGERVVSQTVSSTATVTLDLTGGTLFVIEAGADITVTFSDPPDGESEGVPVSGFGMTLIVKKTVAEATELEYTFSNVSYWAYGSEPTVNQTQNSFMVFHFFTYDAGTTWFGVIGGEFNV